MGFTSSQINEMLTEIAKDELKNINNMQKLIKTDLSYCYCSLKLMCEIYEDVKSRAVGLEKVVFDDISIEELFQERNFIDCLFQLEKNFKLEDVDVELLKLSLGDNQENINVDLFINIFNYFSKLYPDVMKNFYDFVELSRLNNEKFFKVLKESQVNYEKKGNDVMFGLVNLDGEQIETLKDFSKKQGYISCFMKNFVEANDFVTEPIDEYCKE